MKQPTVYILASARRGTLYIGVTSNLVARVHAHRESLNEGFCRRYRIHRLVYYEQFRRMYDAIVREKRLKEWKREWKIRLIERHNPEWVDLWFGISGS